MVLRTSNLKPEKISGLGGTCPSQIAKLGKIEAFLGENCITKVSYFCELH